MTGSLAWLIIPAALALVPVLVVFAFAGCTAFGAAEAPPPVTPPPTPARPYPQATLGESGLVAYWRLGETTGNVARDEGPAHRDGVYTNGVELGQPNGALAAKLPGDVAPLFDGVDDLVEIAAGAAAGDPLYVPLSFSVEAWVSLAPVPAGDTTPRESVFNCLQAVDDTMRGFALFVARAPDPRPSIRGLVGLGTPGATLTDRTDEVNIPLPDAVVAGAWAHIVLTYEGATGAQGQLLTLHLNYLDPQSGAPVSSTVPTPNVAYATKQAGSLYIGAGRASADEEPGNFLSGRIDEVALYNIALKPTTVAEHFKLAKP